MRARHFRIWALLAAVAAYLVLMAAVALQLLGAGTTVYVGSVAALAIGVSAAVFIALFLITRTRRRG
jgi:membrane protein YdbS with pleckstrin-like domain